MINPGPPLRFAGTGCFDSGAMHNIPVLHLLYTELRRYTAWINFLNLAAHKDRLFHLRDAWDQAYGCMFMPPKNTSSNNVASIFLFLVVFSCKNDAKAEKGGQKTKSFPWMFPKPRLMN